MVAHYMQSSAPEFKLAEMTGHWNIGTVCICHFVSPSGLFDPEETYGERDLFNYPIGTQ